MVLLDGDPAPDRRLRVDHLVYATPDLEAGAREVSGLLGIDVVRGGRHPGLGTYNALVSLGADVYLEVIGPAAGSEPPARGRPFGIDTLDRPRLVTWAARAEDIERSAGDALRAGIDLGEVRRMSRQLPNGDLLEWRLTDLYADRKGGALPFLIDWGESPHPASTLPPACSLQSLTVVHPDPRAVEAALRRLGLDVAVQKGPRAGVRARLSTPRGTVELG